jgi:uncharacterized protein (DUF427 family)
MRIEPTAKRIRVYVAGVPIADTTRARLVWEHDRYPAYYLPIADVRSDVLVPSDTTNDCAMKDGAQYFTVKVGGKERVDAARQYADAPDEELRDLIRFDWRAMDAWFEEDEEVFGHPRSPYTRVEVLPSSRHVRVELDGVVLAESHRARILFETNLPARWYIPNTDVRLDVLVPTDSSSMCPYKGTAEYWSARVGDRVEEDIAWSYRTPLPESKRIAGMISFYNHRVDIIVDGERNP